MAREDKYHDRMSKEERDRFSLELSRPTEMESGRQLSMYEYERRVKDFLELIEKRGKPFRVTTNSLVVGRFYYFSYLPRNREDMQRHGIPRWDMTPIILCTSTRERMEFAGVRGATFGFRGINWHHISMRQRKAIMKQYILDNPVNSQKFVANKPLDIFHFDRDVRVRKAGPNGKGANRRYLFKGTYPDPISKEPIPAGASDIRQIPYSNLPELLTLPSSYQANWVY